MKALLLENIHPQASTSLRELGIEVRTVPSSLPEPELLAALDGVQLLGVRSNTALPARVLRAAADLIAVGCFCVGTNHVDLATASEQGRAVFNAPYSNTRSVVELVLGEIVVLARRLGEKSQRMHEGVWDKSARGSHELRGRTLGIVGYGNIGSQLSDVAEAVGLRVVFYDVADRLARGNARRVPSLDALLAESDIVSIHVDGRPGNAGMFGAEQFARMRRGAIFVNASRGMVIDEQALREPLLSGHLAGAAIDVFPVEPKAQGDSFESPLRGLPNVILTPHIAGSTLEAQEDIGRFVAGKLADFVSAGSTALSVNLPAVTLPQTRGSFRVGHLYANEESGPIALNRMLADVGADVLGQSLSTEGALGYVVTDVANAVPGDAIEVLAKSPHTVWVRTWGPMDPAAPGDSSMSTTV